MPLNAYKSNVNVIMSAVFTEFSAVNNRNHSLLKVSKDQGTINHIQINHIPTIYYKF